MPPEETLRVAVALLHDGRAFRAHEVFEAIWKATEGDERELWRALAQLAVGVTHAQRGNAAGSAALLRRGAENLQPWLGRQPHGVDVSALQQWALESAARPGPAEQLVASMAALLAAT